MKLRHYIALALGLLGGYAFATSALDSTPLQSDILIESRYQGARNQLALDPSLIIYYDGGVVGAIALNPALSQNLNGQDAGFNNVTLNALTATSIGNFSGADAGFRNTTTIDAGITNATIGTLAVTTVGSFTGADAGFNNVSVGLIGATQFSHVIAIQSTGQVLNHNTGTTLTATTKLLDQLGEWDGGVFTATYAGLYRASVVSDVAASIVDAGEYYSLNFVQGGSGATAGSQPSATAFVWANSGAGQLSPHISSEFSMDAGDTISVNAVSWKADGGQRTPTNSGTMIYIDRVL